MKIATIMSVYGRDAPGPLERALKSVAQQRFTDPVESRIYLAIDGPIPAFLEHVISQRRAEIFHLHRSPTNAGLAAALNALIDKLQDEELVFRMDADDISRPNRYQAQIDHLKTNPSIDILGTDICEIDTTTGHRRHVSFHVKSRDVRSEICRRVPVAHPTVCFRRHVLQRLQRYPVNRGNEDIAMWFRCAREGFQFGNVQQALLDFTIGPSFWQRRSVTKALTELRCYVLGIWSLHGVTWRYIFPLLRFLLRLAPRTVLRLAYSSSARRAVE
jgi:glycosyltransferase involved in cell wall biosynthesis